MIRDTVEDVYGVSFSPDGRYVATGLWDSSVLLWNARTGDLVDRFSSPRDPCYFLCSIAFSPDSMGLVVGACMNSFDSGSRLEGGLIEIEKARDVGNTKLLIVVC